MPLAALAGAAATASATNAVRMAVVFFMVPLLLGFAGMLGQLPSEKRPCHRGATRTWTPRFAGIPLGRCRAEAPDDERAGKPVGVGREAIGGLLHLRQRERGRSGPARAQTSGVERRQLAPGHEE